MLARAIWAFCLYLSLFTFVTTSGRADSDLNDTGPFWFSVGAAGGNQGYMIDIPIPDLGTTFFGVLPMFFDSPCDLSPCAAIPTALVTYDPQFLIVDSPLLADGGLPGNVEYRFAEGDNYVFAISPFNMVFTTRGNIAVTIAIVDKAVTVPEPATAVLLLSGLVMVGLAAKRKRPREKRRSSRL